MVKLSHVLTEVLSPFVLSGLLLCQIALATDPRPAAPVALHLSVTAIVLVALFNLDI